MVKVNDRYAVHRPGQTFGEARLPGTARPVDHDQSNRAQPCRQGEDVASERAEGDTAACLRRRLRSRSSRLRSPGYIDGSALVRHVASMLPR